MKNYQPGRVTPFTRKKMAPLLPNPIDQPCPYPWLDQYLSIVNQLLDKLNQELNTELQAHVDVLNWPGLICRAVAKEELMVYKRSNSCYIPSTSNCAKT